MALNPVGNPSIPDRLVLVARRSRKTHRAVRKREMVRMPLADLEVRRESAKDRVASRGSGQEDLIHAEFGLGPAEAARAEHVGQNLCAEADAEVRHAGEHRPPNGALLLGNPRKFVVLPDAVPGAHRNDEVVAPPVGQALALVEGYAVHLDAALLQHAAEDSHGVRAQMLERQRAHEPTLLQSARPRCHLADTGRAGRPRPGLTDRNAQPMRHFTGTASSLLLPRERQQARHDARATVYAGEPRRPQTQRRAASSSGAQRGSPPGPMSRMLLQT